MWTFLFGRTEYEQERYLRIRVILTGIALVFSIVCVLCKEPKAAQHVSAIILLMWGWIAIKAICISIAWINTLVNNKCYFIWIPVGLIAGIVGVHVGLIVMPLGIFRYIQLLIRLGR